MGYEFIGFWKLCWAPQNISSKIQRSKCYLVKSWIFHKNDSYLKVNKGEKVDGAIEGTYDSEYGTITSFNTEHVAQGDIMSYGGQSNQNIQQQYSL